MRKILVIVLSLLFVVNIAEARPKRAPKAGEIKDGVYTDNSYGFSITVPEEWDSSIKKDDSNIRLVMVKKEYEIPMQFQHAPNYTTIPKIMIIADTSSLDVRVFVDSILSDEFKTDQKKDIMAETKILFGDFVQRQRTMMEIGGQEGVYLSGNQQYTIQVARQGSQSDKGDVVTDYYGGAVYFARDPETNHLFVINFICEDRYYSFLERQFQDIIKTFSLNKE